MKYRSKNFDPDWEKYLGSSRSDHPGGEPDWERNGSNAREPRRLAGETRRYGRREIPDHEHDEYGWSQYYGEPYPRGYSVEPYSGRLEIPTQSRSNLSAGGEWMQPGPYTGRGPRGYRRSDERILEDVCHRLTRHGRIDARQVSIEVHNGEVTLTGSVDSRRTRRMVEETVEDVTGVVDIDNQLSVPKPGPV